MTTLPTGHARAPRATERPEQGPAAWVGAALEISLRARVPGAHASTPMVRRLAVKVGRGLRLDTQTLALLDLSVRVRDIGMVALPDSVVLAHGPLSPDDWQLVNRHPVIGAQLLEELDVAAAAAHVVRAHHERWDGGGYPDGQSEEAIPVLSRVIAACDAFVAMASDRPHRRGIGAEAALEQVCQESGSQFDPRIVNALVAALTKPPSPSTTGAGTAAPARGRPQVSKPRGGRRDLTTAIADFDPLPALAPACDRILAAIAAERTTGGELVSAIEADIGLTVAILRRAQNAAARRPIVNVADAVAALTAAEMQETVGALPRAAFPWRTSEAEVQLHQCRVHAQAVARTADRIVQEVGGSVRDDVLAVALLHDVGKLMVERVGRDPLDARKTTPEERVRRERHDLGMDHASLGGLVLRKWGLPNRLADAVTAHHTSEAEHEVATYVRLADMIVHHAQTDRVDLNMLMRLAEVCGLSGDTLRDVLFDLPHAGGSQRRRAEPSPLSERETAVLRILAQGKVYKVIASELTLSTSTVRTHLHNVYAKLGVEDRAQAVLRATEMGWL
jgi:putative nucleotidyltransferase with HDIG domain